MHCNGEQDELTLTEADSSLARRYESAANRPGRTLTSSGILLKLGLKISSQLSRLRQSPSLFGPPPFLAPVASGSHLAPTMSSQHRADTALGKRVYAVPARLAASFVGGLDLELKEVQLKGKQH